MSAMRGAIVAAGRRRSTAGLAAGMTAEYDASHAASITLNTGKVSQWADKAGTGVVLNVTDGSGTRPVVATAAHNGLDAVRFDGVDDWLRAATPYGVDPDLMSFYLVCTKSSTTDSYILSGHQPGGELPAIISGYSSKDLEFYNGAERDTIAASTASGLHVISIVRNTAGGYSKVWLDGANVVNRTASFNTALTDFHLTLGGSGGGANPAGVDIAHVIPYMGVAHDDATRQANEAYLKAKWATP